MPSNLFDLQESYLSRVRSITLILIGLASIIEEISEADPVGSCWFVVQVASVEEEPELRMLSGINGSLKDRLEMLEARVLKEAMVRHRWNKTRVADELGLSRVGLRAKLGRYGLERKNGAS